MAKTGKMVLENFTKEELALIKEFACCGKIVCVIYCKLSLICLKYNNKKNIINNNNNNMNCWVTVL